MGQFNGITPAGDERLSLMLEEMGEALQVIGKIQRHGYGPHIFLGIAYDNRKDLERELGDVLYALSLLCESGDVSFDAVLARAVAKRVIALPYLHHQAEPPQ